jgi:deoxyribonucleoside regulator
MIKNPAPTADDKRSDLLIRVASMYYERDYSQQKIADTLNISRSNISRLLKEAKEKGFVEIRVHKRFNNLPDLETALVAAFGLDAAVVLDGDNLSYAARLEQVGQLAAWHLEGLITGEDTIAISWGTGVASAVKAFPSLPLLKTNVVQMIGTVGRVDSVIDSPELARELANKLGGIHYYLHAPLFVDSATTRDLFLQQTTIVETLDIARGAQMALVGVGTTEPGKSSFLRAGHLTENNLERLRREGAVGESGGQHFDINGNAAGLAINQRVIGLNAGELRCLPNKIAVACGLHKTRSIIGALRGGYVNVLATDDVTARAILSEVGSYD